MIIGLLVDNIRSTVTVTVVFITIINIVYPFFTTVFSMWRIGNSGGLRGVLRRTYPPLLLLRWFAGSQVDARRCICA